MPVNYKDLLHTSGTNVEAVQYKDERGVTTNLTKVVFRVNNVDTTVWEAGSWHTVWSGVSSIVQIGNGNYFERSKQITLDHAGTSYRITGVAEVRAEGDSAYSGWYDTRPFEDFEIGSNWTQVMEMQNQSGTNESIAMANGTIVDHVFRGTMYSGYFGAFYIEKVEAYY